MYCGLYRNSSGNDLYSLKEGCHGLGIPRSVRSNRAKSFIALNHCKTEVIIMSAVLSTELFNLDQIIPMPGEVMDPPIVHELGNVATDLSRFAHRLAYTHQTGRTLDILLQLRQWASDKPTVETLLAGHLDNIAQVISHTRGDRVHHDIQVCLNALVEHLSFLALVFESETHLAAHQVTDAWLQGQLVSQH